MARPNPLPPYLRVSEELAWVKLAKISASLADSIPIPVSATEKRTALRRVSAVLFSPAESSSPAATVN